VASAVGTAIALRLAQKGYKVTFYASEHRAKHLLSEMRRAEVDLQRATALSDMNHFTIVVLGAIDNESDADVIASAGRDQWIGLYATTVPSLFHEGVAQEVVPIDSVKLPTTVTSRHGLYKDGAIPAWQVGTLVHAFNAWTTHETGEVDLLRMDLVWKSARELGFSVAGDKTPAWLPEKIIPGH